MGMYDTYGKNGVQLKVGENLCHYFKVGDPVDILDGVYVGYEGVIVIKDGIFIAEFDHITDKYGGPLKNDEVFHNPLSDVVLELKEKYKKSE
jgi:hypothetical protein